MRLRCSFVILFFGGNDTAFLPVISDVSSAFGFLFFRSPRSGLWRMVAPSAFFFFSRSHINRGFCVLISPCQAAAPPPPRQHARPPALFKAPHPGSVEFFTRRLSLPAIAVTPGPKTSGPIPPLCPAPRIKSRTLHLFQTNFICRHPPPGTPPSPIKQSCYQLHYSQLEVSMTVKCFPFPWAIVEGFEGRVSLFGSLGPMLPARLPFVELLSVLERCADEGAVLRLRPLPLRR